MKLIPVLTDSWASSLGSAVIICSNNKLRHWRKKKPQASTPWNKSRTLSSLSTKNGPGTANDRAIWGAEGELPPCISLAHLVLCFLTNALTVSHCSDFYYIFLITVKEILEFEGLNSKRANSCWVQLASPHSSHTQTVEVGRILCHIHFHASTLKLNNFPLYTGWGDACDLVELYCYIHPWHALFQTIIYQTQPPNLAAYLNFPSLPLPSILRCISVAACLFSPTTTTPASTCRLQPRGERYFPITFQFLYVNISTGSDELCSTAVINISKVSCLTELTSSVGGGDT